MKAKKFIKGTFKLDKDVSDLQSYENQHMPALKEIINYADDHLMSVRFGTSEDNTYLVEFTIRGLTAQYCKGVLSDFRAMLKNEWKQNVSLLIQQSGSII